MEPKKLETWKKWTARDDTSSSSAAALRDGGIPPMCVSPVFCWVVLLGLVPTQRRGRKAAPRKKDRRNATPSEEGRDQAAPPKRRKRKIQRKRKRRKKKKIKRKRRKRKKKKRTRRKRKTKTKEKKRKANQKEKKRYKEKEKKKKKKKKKRKKKIEILKDFHFEWKPHESLRIWHPRTCINQKHVKIWKILVFWFKLECENYNFNHIWSKGRPHGSPPPPLPEVGHLLSPS